MCRSNAARCTGAHLLAHAPKHLHEEVKASSDMVHARRRPTSRQQGFLASGSCAAGGRDSWKSGERLFTFLRYPPGSGARSGPQMLSSGCTRSSSGGSTMLLPARDRACCSGRFWLGSDHLAQGRRLGTACQPPTCLTALSDKWSGEKERLQCWEIRPTVTQNSNRLKVCCLCKRCRRRARKYQH